ncbi:Fcf2 pre-rRNA processing [Rhizoctonia solani]|uniref:Fcf2 pre-rRNA processing n=1 Tax=Rhizoctonia solani TaxID=456999 RepID=A0A8H7M7C4_9AGAM|nr:Fcf2 pre-rRNA processing [Rhizoctonia solani]
MSRAASPTLQQILEKAVKACTVNTATDEANEEDVLTLTGDDDLPPLPKLDPGLSGKAIYFDCKAVSDSKTFELEDDSAAQVKQKSQYKGKERQKGDGLSDEEGTEKKLTKRERKELKFSTTGPQWFDLPAPSDADRPRLARSLKREKCARPETIYRKDAEGSKREMPKYFAIGKVVDAATPFRDADHSQNLTRAERKRTIVEELVEDAEARRQVCKKEVWRPTVSTRRTWPGYAGSQIREKKAKMVKITLR